MGVLSAVEHIFNESAMHARVQASNRLARANRASHGPRVRAKERAKRTRENAKTNLKEPKVPKGRTRVKTSKTGRTSLENPKSETSSETQESAQTCLTILGFMMAGVTIRAKSITFLIPGRAPTVTVIAN